MPISECLSKLLMRWASASIQFTQKRWVALIKGHVELVTSTLCLVVREMPYGARSLQRVLFWRYLLMPKTRSKLGCWIWELASLPRSRGTCTWRSPCLIILDGRILYRFARFAPHLAPWAAIVQRMTRTQLKLLLITFCLISCSLKIGVPPLASHHCCFLFRVLNIQKSMRLLTFWRLALLQSLRWLLRTLRLVNARRFWATIVNFLILVY